MGLRIYGGTARGVIAITENDGGCFEINKRRCLPEWEITELLADGSGLLIAGTRGDGVWRQTDTSWEGRTGGWKKPNYGRRGPGKVHCVTVDPVDPDTMYVGNEPISIWVTHDGGENCELLDGLSNTPSLRKISHPVRSLEPHVRDISIDPSNHDIMYAALQIGYAAKSTDGGLTWSLLTGGIDASVHTLVIRPDNPSHIYAATGGHGHRAGETAGKALYVSTDVGETWSPMADEFEQDYALSLTIHPQDSDILLSAVANGSPPWSRPSGAEARMIGSTDGGKSWHEVATSLEEIGPEFPGCISFDPASPDDVFMCTHQGKFFRSRNGGNDWDRIPVDLAAFGGLTERGLSSIIITHI